MEYQYIVNPQTGRKCNVNSKTGRQVIQNYAQEGGMFKFGMKARIRNKQEPISINKGNVHKLRELIAQYKTNRNYALTLGEDVYRYNYELRNLYGKDGIGSALYDKPLDRNTIRDMEAKGCKPYRPGETITMKLSGFKKVKGDKGEVEYLPLYYLNHFVKHKLKQPEKLEDGDVYVYIFKDIKNKRDIAILNRGMWAELDKHDEVSDGVVRFKDSDISKIKDGMSWGREDTSKGGQIKVFYDGGDCFKWGYKRKTAPLHYTFKH